MFKIKFLQITILFEIISICSLSVNAQQRFNLQSYIQPAPNAAELGKYGSIPVGTLTGIPEIGFPLYEISSGSLKLPITLSYHASGIQVNQKATDAGLGWVVNAGGQISRTVYGAPDNNPNNGYFNYTAPSYNELLNMQSYYTMQLYSNPGYDLEPDLFTYNIGGKSGKFIFTKEKNFMTIPFEPIKISVQNQNSKSLTTFQITDDNGVVYNFTQYAHVNPDWKPSEFIITSWYLTSMISSDLVDTISFEYEAQAMADFVTQQTYPIGQKIDCPSTEVFFTGTTGSLIETHTNVTNYDELLIKKIKFRGGYILFNRNTTRLDLEGTTKALDEIKVYDLKNTVIKTFSFNHSYFDAGDNSYPQTSNKRLKLDGFTESDPAITIKKEYKFAYNSVNLPATGSFGMDYWGYYNGAVNQSLIPTTTIRLNDLSTVDFLHSETFSNNFVNPDISYTIGNANREPSADFMQAGMLKKITYPTGGYSQFEFAPHQYLSDEYITQNRVGSCFAQGINKSTVSESTSNFRYPSDSDLDIYNPNGTGFGTLVINFSPSNMGNMEYGETQVAILTDLTTNTAQTWKHEGDLTLPYSVQANIRLWTGHTYRFKHSIYGPNTVAVTSNISWTENTAQHPVKIGGGLRVQSVKNYTADNSLAKVETYSYGENGIGVKLFDEYNFYKNYEDQAIFYVSAGEMSDGAMRCFPQGARWQRNFTGISHYSSLNYMGSPILYSSVTKYEGTATANTGRTVSTYHIVKDQTVVPKEFINSGNYGAINNAWNQGDLTDEVVYKFQNGQYLPVIKMHYDYLPYNESTTTAIKMKQIEQVLYPCGDCFNPAEDHTYSPIGGNNLKAGQGFYSFFEYPIKTGVSKRVKETKTVYDQSDISKTLTTVTEYKFENPLNLYPSEVKVTNSDGSKSISRVKYPHDFVSQQPYTEMVNSKHIWNTPVEQTTYKNDLNTLLQTTKTNFGFWNGNAWTTGITNQILPKTIETKFKNNNVENRVQFTEYSIKSNLLEQQKSNDIKEVYLWGYNQMYPVAKITGKSYAEVTSQVSLDFNRINDINTDDATMRQELNKLRSLTNCFVTTYTYKPLVGMTSQTDPNGITSYYLYDAFNRLQFVKDQDGRILKKICYNYAGQVTDCTINTTPNWTATGNVQCVTSGGVNTGYQQREEKDVNSYSSTYNQTRWVDNGYNVAACPVPSSCIYSNCEINGPQYKCVYGTCEWGYQIFTGSYYDWNSGMYVCVYHYEWSDGTWSQDYNQYSWGECYIN